MTEKAKEVLRECVLKDITVCNRCFSKSAAKQDRVGSVSSVTPCSEDKCGEVGISMESETVDHIKLKPRADNLLEILKENGHDVESDLFYRAVEKYAKLYEPKKVFTKAIAYGLGHRDPAVLNATPDQSDEDDEQDEEETIDSAVDAIAHGPTPRRSLQQYDDYELIKDELGVFEVAMTHTLDICYLRNADEFAEAHGVEDMKAHDPRAVVDMAVGTNWTELTDASTGILSKWIQRTDDEFSSKILPSVVMRARIPIFDDEFEFQRSGFWPLVKRRINQPVLGNLQKFQKDIVSPKEISEKADMDEDLVEKSLRMLMRVGCVESRQNGYKYIPEDQRPNPDSRLPY